MPEETVIEVGTADPFSPSVKVGDKVKASKAYLKAQRHFLSAVLNMSEKEVEDTLAAVAAGRYVVQKIVADNCHCAQSKVCSPRVQYDVAKVDEFGGLGEQQTGVCSWIVVLAEEEF